VAENELQVETERTEKGKNRLEWSNNLRRRKITNSVATGAIFVAVILAIIPLFLILSEVILKGAPVISLQFLTNLPTPVNVPGGGVANAIEGSFVMVAIASLIALPIGVGAGIFLSEWGESGFSAAASFTNDVLAEFPSIVIGIFVYVVIVLTTHTFSAFAGAFALAIIMIPIVARTTEESLKLVPRSLREASMALGVSRWRTITQVVLSTGRGGLVTGILLAVARAAGETAPLLLTALGSTLALTSLLQPTAALPLLIYTYGISPFRDWQDKAWGAALVLVIVVLALNLTVKAITRGKFITVVE
jgi:phosphate transport system permease protein